jgi:uncharacterized protein (DUF433 family)
MPRRISRRLSQGNVAQLVADYEAGATTRQLTATYGISKTSVQSLLHERGVLLRHHGVSGTQVSEAVQRYESGKSVAQVANALDLSPSSVYGA